MDSRAGISIVVPVYNGAGTLDGCLRALLRQDLCEPYEVLVIDDGSLDDSREVACQYAPRVRLLRQDHKGAAAARNTGVRAATGEIVLFTDADCEPVAGWASALVRAIRAGADGAKGTYRTRQRSITARFVQAEYEGKYRRMAGRTRIDFIDTYSAGYRREALLRTGGFDERISAVEDQELSFRLAKMGAQLRFVPEAVVWHTHAATPGAYLRKKYWIGYWKVRVVALHPERIATDSHTPPSLKAQMALLGLALPLLGMSPAWKPARIGLGVCGVGFVATTLPFSASVARKDLGVAIAAPAMMLLRAVGLTSGFLSGMWRFGRRP